MAHDPREPLTPEEVAVAHLYTALPRPEPSPALDARVLAQARAAVATTAATPRRRARPWYLMPGTGVAAAAVLAAGLAWQVGLLGDGRVQDASTVSPPAAAPSAVAEAKRDDRVSVEFVRREQARAAEQAAQADAASKPAPEAAAPAPAPPPAAPRRTRAPDAFPKQESAPTQDAAAPAGNLRMAPAPSAPEPLGESAAAPAEVSGLQRERPDAETEERGALDRIEVTGSRVRGGAAALPPWPDDASLPPADWIERVRDRVRAGDRDGARSSLRRFVRVHPGQAVPDDLTLLLVQ